MPLPLPSTGVLAAASVCAATANAITLVAWVRWHQCSRRSRIALVLSAAGFGLAAIGALATALGALA